MANKEILAIIPARGGSKGIKRKNMVLVENIPLIQYTITAAKDSSFISRMVVNSDDDEILEYARNQECEVFVRPEELAQDDTPMKDVILYQLKVMKEQEGYVPDIIVLLQPTSPLRSSSHIDEAMQSMLSCDCDALVSVIEEPHLHSPYSVMKKNENGYLDFFIEEGKRFNSRQEKPKFYARNGAAIYAVFTESYIKTGSLYGTKCIPYEMEPEDSVDIDSPLDLYLVKSMIQYKKEQKKGN